MGRKRGVSKGQEADDWPESVRGVKFLPGGLKCCKEEGDTKFVQCMRPDMQVMERCK